MTYNFLSPEYILTCKENTELIYVELIMSSSTTLSVLIIALQFSKATVLSFSCYDPLSIRSKKSESSLTPMIETKIILYCKEGVNIRDTEY